ncbi:MAG: Gfo/Idh/MocA family oxidoreductase [Sphaerochaetaceae bacterium]
MKEIKYGIIGTGSIASSHAEALCHIPGSRLVAVCGHSPEHTRMFATQWEIHGYDDIAAMLAEEGIQAVIIATSHASHAKLTVAALRAGANVLCEKPLAITPKECQEDIDCALSAHKILGVMGQRRWFPPTQRMQRAINEGKIGHAMLGQVTVLEWRDAKYYASAPWRGKWETEGGGVTINQASHQLDMLCWFLGPVKEVYGCYSNINHPYIEVEDTTVATVKFKGGAIASLMLSNSQNPGLYNTVHIFGDNGAAVGVQTDGGTSTAIPNSGDIPFNDLWTIPGEESLREKWKEEDRRFFASHSGSSYFLGLQIADFSDAVREERDPLVTGWDGLETVRLIDGIYRSFRTGKPILY